MTNLETDPRALRDRLAGSGVTLWVDGDQLRFRGPKGALGQDDLAALRALKPALLELLGAEEGVRPDPAARHEPFPLTDVQASYLLGRGSAFAYGGLGCHGYLEIAFPELDPVRLDQAWRTVVSRHDMLRAVVHPDGYQQVLTEVPPYQVTVVDLRHDPDPAAALAGTRARMSHRVYRPEQWPLFDLRISRLPGRDVLHVSVDLLIADYTSVQILLTELDSCYQGESLAPVELSYRDWLLAERRGAGTPAAQRDQDWWFERLDTLPPAPALPTLAGAATTAPAVFRRHSAELDPATWAALRKRATANGITAAGALLAGYAEVVGRWSAEPAFTLNLTLLNRQPVHPHVHRVVGDFTAVELLEVRPDPAATFAARAATLGDQLFADLDHRRFGGVQVLRELARRRGSAAALMPVVFTSTVGLADEAVAGGRLTGTGELQYAVSQTPQVWIDCQVSEFGGALQVHWDVRDGVLPPEVVGDMFAAYEALLRGLAGGDEVWVATSVVDLPAAQLARREAVNATAAPLPEGTLHAGVLDQARRTPDRVAVVCGADQLSYRDLARRAGAVAQSLRARGCQAGELVAVVLDKGVDQIVAVLGVLVAGGAYLPVDTNQPAARRDTILVNSGVRLVLADRAGQADAWPAAVTVLPVAGVTPASADPVGHDPAELAYVIHTSGSTGVPKGVMTSHRAALNTVVDINQRFAVTSGDTVLGLAALGFDLSVYDIFGPLAVGGRLVLPDHDRRGDPAHWAELVAEHGVTLWNSVPAQLQLLQEYLSVSPQVQLPTLRLALLSGDWIPVTLPDAVRTRLPGLQLVSLGGATEAAIWSIHHRIGEVPQSWTSIPYGTPLANQRWHVLDSALRPCPEYVPGELYIAGAGLADGYLGNAEETARRFRCHPVTGERLYRTGDHGRYLPDGIIEFLGRRDSQVKIRGHRIELAEIEAALTSHPAVGAAAAVAAGPARHERRLAAFVTPAARSGPPDGATDAVTAAARAAAAAVLSEVRPAQLVEFAGHLDQVALLAMAAALRAAGLFPTADAHHDLDQVLTATRAVPRHRRLLRRWLAVLTENGLLERNDRHGYRLAVDPALLTAAALRDHWRRLDDFGARYGTELVRYLRTCAERLPELLRGEADPLELLFPEGRLEVAEGAYRDNLVSRCVNGTLAATLATIAASHDRSAGPLRVMEVGAGVGGTTVDLVAALDRTGAEVDYLFTDLSQFFLNQAAERFAGHDWVRFGTFDLNADHRQQGMLPNTLDVVVCANVLHNARHAGEVLGRLAELVRPGGWLLFIEATRDSYPLMASMEFQEGLTDFVDERASSDRTFHTSASWTSMLAELGTELAYRFPEPGHPLDGIGQHVFAARVDPGRVAPHLDELAEHLRARLPGYMVPSEVQVLDALPLTANGKLARQTMEGWLRGGMSGAAPADTGAAPEGDLEERIAALWAQTLGVAQVGRDRDFYALGGDSLLVAQVVGRLREQLPEAADVAWEELMRQLLAAPTVAALASYLAEPPAVGPTATGSRLSPLVTLSEARRGEVHSGDAHSGEDLGAATLVLVHDGSGTLSPYQALVAALRDRGPLVGLTVVDTDSYLDTDPGQLFEVLAADYRHALLDAGHKRVHIVGYCMGGLLATELARQLTEVGADVTRLTVISSYQVPYLVGDDLIAEYAFARTLGVDPAVIGLPSGPAAEGALGAAALALLAENPAELADGRIALLGGTAQLDLVAGAFAAAATRPQAERLAAIARASTLLDADRVGTAWRVFRQGLDAVTRLRATPYAGDITFLRQLGDTHFLPGLRADMTAYWRELCLGSLDVVDIAGDHFSCLRQPHVSAVAEFLRGAR